MFIKILGVGVTLENSGMDNKKQYSSKVALQKYVAEKHPDLMATIKAGKRRSELWSNQWDTVDINEIVEKFAPGANAEIKGGKIYFSSDRYDVVADIGGGYLRIRDKKIGAYVNQNGDDVRNEVVDGKIRGRSKSEQMRLTHFAIKKEDKNG